MEPHLEGMSTKAKGDDDALSKQRLALLFCARLAWIKIHTIHARGMSTIAAICPCILWFPERMAAELPEVEKRLSHAEPQMRRDVYGVWWQIRAV
jgi:hypothetical protein